MAETDGGITADSHFLGTLDFLAPEQASNAKAVDIRADIYGLGCTFYYLLVGKAPFANEKTLVQKIFAHANNEPESLAKFRGDVPGKVEAIVMKMLAKDPGERFQNCEELAVALKSWAKDSNLPELINSLPPLHQIKNNETVIARDDSTIPPPKKKAEPAKKRNKPVRFLWIALALVSIAIAFASIIVIQIRNQEGTLIVEVDSEFAEVHIKNEKVTIKDLERNRAFVLSLGETKLKPGNYEILVTEDSGLEFRSGNRFTIKRNDREILRAFVRTDSKPDLKRDSVENESVQNQVLDWVFRCGGFVEMNNGKEKANFSKRNSQTEEWVLTHIFDVNPTDKSGFSLLPQLPELGSMSLTGPVGYADLSEIEKCKHMHFFRLTGAWVNDRVVGQIASLPLQQLQLEDSSVTNLGVKILGKTEGLRTLGLTDCPHINDGTIDLLAQFPSLEDLDLSGTQITKAGLSRLHKIQNLWRLTFRFNRKHLTDDSLAVLANLPNLRSLLVDEGDITAAGVARLVETRLNILSLRSTPITDVSLSHLAGLKSLEDLNIDKTNTSLSAIKTLSKRLPNCFIIYSSEGKLKTMLNQKSRNGLVQDKGMYSTESH